MAGKELEMTMSLVRCFAAAGLALGVVMLPACETLDPTPLVNSITPPTTPPAEPAPNYDDPIVVSQLREKALEEVAKRAIDPRAELRANALEAMQLTPARLEQFIPPGLKDENVGVRATAATLVGRLKMSRLAPAVRPLLTDPSPFVRASAIFALHRNGQQVEVTPLGQMLLTDPSPRVRSHTAFLIGEMGDSSAVGMLRDASKENIPRAPESEIKMLQVQLAEAMVKLGDAGKIEVVRAALYPSRPEDLEVAALAVQVIGELRDKPSASELIHLTAYKDRSGSRMPAEIRLGAAAAMAKLGNTRGSFIADEFLSSEFPPLRAQAAYVYGETRRRENLPKLAQLLEDPEARVRIAAAAAILKVTSRLPAE
jgi:HEAT repeat protein